MKVTKEDLRWIIREAVKQKHERQDGHVQAGKRVTEGSITFITKDILAALIDDEYQQAVARRAT